MIAPQHSQEWLDSAVDPDITRLNVFSLEGSAAYDYLCYSDKLERTNPGRLTSGTLRTYSFLDETDGWWCSGVDPINNWEPMLWGCFKPSRPRIDFEKQKPIKYEHPPKEETRCFLLAMPDHLWEKVSERYNIPIADEDRQRGFWHWVWKYNVPISIVEGAKKAGALLTAGCAAIGLPGHTGGYRHVKNEFGQPTGKREFIPDLKKFATLGREISICFDRDEKAKTIRSVSNSIRTLGSLFTNEGCKVRVIRWDEPYKGVDDFIAALGAEAFQKVYDAALTLESWDMKTSSQLTYAPALELNQRYLGELSIPNEAKLVCIRSPKGTGKTESLIPIVQEAIANGQWVLLPGHRIQLVQDLCQRLGIDYIADIRSSETGKIIGYGLCVDSLHPKGQAQFNASNWRDGVVILDEAEQVIWHTLNSTTCQKERVSILTSLRTLLTNVINSPKGRIILSDADLSDLSVDFVKGLAEKPDLIPWVCINNWKPEAGWNVHIYDTYGLKGELLHQPTSLLEALITHIREGGKPIIHTDSQKAKSTWGSQTLEAKIKQEFPDKRILRIDSESVSETGHPALGCITKLNEVLSQYDIVICSPAIETGVSIDIKGHFTSVWGFFKGVIPHSSVLQSLHRLRENVDRHIWVRTWGIGKIGNDSTSYKAILASQNKVTKANIRLLRDENLENIDFQFDRVALVTWAKMAARINAGMLAYRQHVIEGLYNEGHQINIVQSITSPELDALKGEVIQCRDEQHQAECEGIAASEDLSTSEYNRLKDKRAKSKAERRAERKHEMKMRYTEDIDVTPDLVEKDDKGWHPKIRLHYLLTVGRPHLKARDTKRVESLTEDSLPKAWMPDFNKSVLSAKVAVLENLGVLGLTNPDIEYRGTDENLVRLALIAKAHPRDIKDALGITISKDDTPIAIAQKLLATVGQKLKCIGRFGSRDNRQRVYKFVAPSDGRDAVFAAWLRRDEISKLEFDPLPLAA